MKTFTTPPLKTFTTVPPLIVDFPHFRFCLKERIGGGGFGVVYKASSPCFKEEFAVKTEPTTAKTPQLLNEYELYRVLNGGPGIPKIKWFGTEGGFHFMVMDLLGPSLDAIISDKRYSRFSLKTTLMLVDQMIERLEYLHNKDYIHRDVKPDNFLMGRGSKKNIVYMADLGLCKRFKDAVNRDHIFFKGGKGMVGTARYASVHSHCGLELSRRDDLESLGYILVLFLIGRLPWQGLKISNENQKYEEICILKIRTSPETLCNKCPPEFITFLKYVKALRFDERPNYFYLRRLLRQVFLRSMFVLDFVFDWTENSNSNVEPESESNSRAVLRQCGSIASLPRRKLQNVQRSVLLIIPPFHEKEIKLPKQKK